ncbi:MAG: Histidine--tRNA ligase [Parcubacteria group bacterium]|nr:Histidine--tRNA ligase [Parcubacteria group bacterium]
MSKQTKKPAYLLHEFDRPIYLAAHFGFTPINYPKVKDIDLKLTEDCRIEVEGAKPLRTHDAAEKAAFLRMYAENDFASLPHPLSVIYRKPEKRAHDYCLHVLGFPSAVAEAILIRTGLTILMEEGHKRLVVEVNSVGDKDSVQAYERELHAFVRKVAAEIPPEHKKRIKEDVFELLKLALPEEIKGQLPSSIASLTSPSRAHFKEMLECLESLGVEFRLDCRLIGSKHYSSHTIFAIRDADSEMVLAEGSRYSRLTKRVGFKKELPSASMTIFAHAKKDGPEKIYKDLPKPKFYLIHLGHEAKLKSLPLIELLRTHRIPVYHFLGKDKITAQLAASEELRVPYLLIVGHKEALDHTVTVRNVSTRAQDTISMDDLPDYLKHLPF